MAYKIGYKKDNVWKYVWANDYSELSRTVYHYLLIGDGKVSVQRVDKVELKG